MTPAPRLLHISALCAAGLGLLAALVLHVAAVQCLDLFALRNVADHRSWTTVGLSKAGAGLADPAGYALLSALVLALSAARRQWRAAAVIAVLLIAAPVVTELLKLLLATPRPNAWPALSISDEAFPSGHATAAATVGIAATLAAAPRWRPAVGLLGLALTAWVSVSIVLLGWHFPSDVLGGLLVATGCGALAAATARAPARPNGAWPTAAG